MDKKHIFDEPKNVKRLLVSFYAILVILVSIDFFIPKHPHFAWEEWPQFFAVYGFVACVLLVLVSKYVLRPLVKRKEDYYD
ncbi:MAG: hypothetical protein C4581_08925 [Nitrospiraceae bacterium]|nr:MAG: hypothetical protein C4581_08925 [Nitrospiraceae bacterium]